MENQQDFFLATTALEEFWDKNKSIIFLGPWCLRFKNQENYKHLCYQVLRDQWQSATDLKAAQQYIEVLYQEVLPLLADKLNHIHQTKHTLRFWEILLGPWLRVYLTVIYDRFLSIEKVHAFIPNMTTYGLAANLYESPITNAEFVNLLATDEFNLQIYTQIFKFLKIPIVEKVLGAVPQQIKQLSLKEQLKNKIRRLGNAIFTRLGRKRGILLVESGFPLPVLAKFFVQSLGFVVPITHLDPIQSEHNQVLRQQLATLSFGRSEMEKCAAALIPHYLPRAYLEAYASLCKWTKSLKLKPRIIFSSMGWHYSERFKYLAAFASETHTLLCGHQHGGDYGILDYHIAELHETKVLDHFYTWGWHAKREEQTKYLPFTGLKLQERKINSHKAPNEIILYGCANNFRYLRRFHFSPAKQLEYFAMQREFILNLPQELLDHLLIRLHPVDWGWDRKERFLAVNQGLQFQSHAIPFKAALGASKIYVADHISTTFSEAMAANKPTILFCDEEMWEIRADAKPYFEALKAANVYFNNAVDAAQHLQNVYAHVDDWWQESSLKAAVKDFREHFSRPPEANLSDWHKMFISFKSQKEMNCM